MAERRQHPRIDLIAQVEVSTSEVVHLLRAINASRGGLFLEGNPENYPHFQQGLEVELQVCEIELDGDGDGDPDSEDTFEVSARARIVRVDPAGAGARSGFALEFTALDEENRERLASLLARAGT